MNKEYCECRYAPKTLLDFKIIDGHCHVFPEKIAEKASEGIGNFYDGLFMRHRGSVSELEYVCDNSFGFNKSPFAGVVINSVATKPEQVLGINEFILETVKNDRFFTGLATLFPFSPETEILEVVKRAKTAGLKGVKLHPDFQKFKINDRKIFKVYEILEAEKMPLLIHTGDSRYDFSKPGYLKDVLEIFKDLVVIAAHFGGWSEWEDADATLAGKFENLYVDTSSSFYYQSVKTATERIHNFSAERVIFGTDYPMWSAMHELDFFARLNLTNDERKAVLAENAARVFGINLKDEKK